MPEGMLLPLPDFPCLDWVGTQGCKPSIPSYPNTA